MATISQAEHEAMLRMLHTNQVLLTSILITLAGREAVDEMTRIADEAWEPKRERLRQARRDHS
jgi:hypothetical protein